MRYRARVEYDGTDFAGFQVNPGRRTVQGELQAALARLDPTGSGTVDAAGRTDAGVHAAGQVIAFTYGGRSSAEELGRALDALLPADVSIGDLQRVPAGFDPRYAARYREYRYTVWNGPRSPLRERHALGVGTRSMSPRWLEPGRSSLADTTSAPSGRRTGRRSGPFARFGSRAGAES